MVVEFSPAREKRVRVKSQPGMYHCISLPPITRCVTRYLRQRRDRGVLRSGYAPGGKGKKECPAKPALSATALFTQLTSSPVRLSACVPAAHDLSHFRKFVRRYRLCVRISARASASETNRVDAGMDGSEHEGEGREHALCRREV